jgi:hypothetical protein
MPAIMAAESASAMSRSARWIAFARYAVPLPGMPASCLPGSLPSGPALIYFPHDLFRPAHRVRDCTHRRWYFLPAIELY